jgi:hypothetical protein
MSAQHVGEIFGVVKSTVARYYPDKVWTNEQSVQHAQMMRAFNRKMAKSRV